MTLKNALRKSARPKLKSVAIDVSCKGLVVVVVEFHEGTFFASDLWSACENLSVLAPTETFMLSYTIREAIEGGFV